MMNRELDALYSSTNQQTLAQWQVTQGIGEPRGAYYDPRRLALAAGIQPEMPAQIRTLLDDLQQLAGRDPLADILPAEGFHFTFLPLTLPLYEPGEPLPEKIQYLTTCWKRYHAQTIKINALRLVALPGQLLLAGIADEQAIAMRHAFCQQVLHSTWRDELLARHPALPLPPLFWHSTLLRYGATYLPQTLREFFLARQGRDYGDVAGSLKLARINYNWTQCYPLD